MPILKKVGSAVLVAEVNRPRPFAFIRLRDFRILSQLRIFKKVKIFLTGCSIGGVKVSINALFWLVASDYRTYNLTVSRKLKSISAAIILTELVDRMKYHSDNQELVDGEWFYHTQEAMEHRTSLSRHEQDSGISILEKCGLIERKRMGVPAKRYFKINQDKILEFFDISLRMSSLPKTGKLDCRKPANKIAENRQSLNNVYEPKEEPNEDTSAGTADASLSSFSSKDDLLEEVDEKSNITYISGRLEVNKPKLNQTKRKLNISKSNKYSDYQGIPRRENVHTSEEYHLKLVEKNGKEFTEQVYDYLSDWKKDKTTKEIGKPSDQGRIQKWVIDAVREKNIKERELKQREDRLNKVQLSTPPASTDPELIEQRRAYIKDFIYKNWSKTKGRVEDKVTFVQIGNDKIYYDNPKYAELCKHSLEKIK